MKQLQSLSHTVWECKYYIVWIMCTCYCRFLLNMGWQK